MHGADATITDFLTDGSLAALCEAATAFAGAPVTLRDPLGRTIVAARPGFGQVAGVSGRAWAVRERVAGDGESPDGAPAWFAAPLSLSSGPIGELAILGGESGGEPPGVERPEDVRRFVTLLASIVSELCEREVQLRRRVDELEAMRRLSTLLAGAGETGALLHVAIRSAVELLGADAGTVRAFDESGKLLVLRAWHGLSPDYIAASVAVPADSVPDRAALTGDVVIIEDLLSETSAPNLDARRREGLVSMMAAGLVFGGRPLGVMRLFSKNKRRFSAAERGLFRAIAEQSATALASRRLLETERDHRRVQRQVRLAADVQKRLLPGRAPVVPNVQVAGRAIPSFELSGDFYDFIELNGHLGVAVGDVVGKGVAAALLMAAVRSFLRAYAQDLYDLDEIVNRVNQALCRDTLDNEFATLFYGVLDPHRLRLTYCNAGHEPPIVVSMTPGRAPALSDLHELTTGGMAVGVDPAQRYQRGSFDLKPGDVLLAYTDGLPDTMSFDGEKYGKKRVRQALLDVLSAEPDATADKIADHLVWENRRFSGLNRRVDDTTLVVLRAMRA